VPWFFRLIFERRITETRSKDELHEEIDRARIQHEHVHAPLTRARQAKPQSPPGGDDA
jgi:hypothetical protein